MGKVMRTGLRVINIRPYSATHQVRCMMRITGWTMNRIVDAVATIVVVTIAAFTVDSGFPTVAI